MSDQWNANVYSQFLPLRTRPARDLLNALPISFKPHNVYDLGCGPGNSTRLLKDRWSNAKVIGIDASPDMLNKAADNYPDLDFRLGEIAHFLPDTSIDFLFANASLHWLPNHETLFPFLLQTLRVNGAFAIQMPNNFHAPSHQGIIDVLQNNRSWQSLVSNMLYGALNNPRYELAWYYDLFTQCGMHDLQLWQTTYLQEMNSYEEIFNWIQGTVLRPVFAKMNNEDQAQFKKKYLDYIALFYEVRANSKILMSFDRIFMVGFK